MLNNPLRVYDDVTGAIGKTPMIRLNHVTKEHGIKCQVYVKCDFLSAGGSSKDRIGYSMIIEAEKKGIIKPGDTIVEATSGNTGVGLVLTAIARGYKSLITIPDKMSTEKINVLKALGAQVFITPTALDHSDPGSYTGLAREYGRLPNHYYIEQYENLDNQLAHYITTGEEVWEQMESKLDYFFVSIGTGGTTTGTSKKLKEKDPNVKIIAIDPHGSILAKPEELNKCLKSYKIEGIGQIRIPGNVSYALVDEFVKTWDQESFLMARDLVSKEGLIVGGSSGSVTIGAFRYLKEKGLDQNEDLRVVIFLSDTGKNYMTKFMNDNWMVGCGFYPTSRLQNPEHPLDNLTVSSLKNLTPLPYYDARLTVNDLKKDTR